MRRLRKLLEENSTEEEAHSVQLHTLHVDLTETGLTSVIPCGTVSKNLNRIGFSSRRIAACSGKPGRATKNNARELSQAVQQATSELAERLELEQQEQVGALQNVISSLRDESTLLRRNRQQAEAQLEQGRADLVMARDAVEALEQQLERSKEQN